MTRRPFHAKMLVEDTIILRLNEQDELRVPLRKVDKLLQTREILDHLIT